MHFSKSALGSITEMLIFGTWIISDTVRLFNDIMRLLMSEIKMHEITT